MTYGPPQRFKAVITKDNNENREGECSNPFDLDSDVRGNELASPLRREIWWNNRLPKAVIYHLYQSTGRHDKNEKEIFFGDVLLNIEPRMGVHPGVFVTVVFVDGQIFMRCDGQALDMSDPPSKGHYRIEKCDSFAVVGNIHNSPEQLQAAAEKVRADL